MLLLTKGKPQIQCCQTTAKTPGAVSHQVKWYSLFTASSAIEHLLGYCFYPFFFFLPTTLLKRSTYNVFHTLQNLESSQTLFVNNHWNGARGWTSDL